MRKRITVTISLVTICATFWISAFLRTEQKSSTRDGILTENVEALANGESSPSGVYYDCNDEVCMVFDYKNRFLARGCKAADGYICTVQKTELPDISL